MMRVPMRDITNPRLLFFKGFLFLFAGLLAAFLLVLEHPTLKVALLLALAVWCFARFYYFCFCAAQHYADPRCRFSGLRSFALCLLRRRGPVKSAK
jgi:hypothetical protein